MKNIPALRFSEFSESWTSYKLSEIADKIKDGTHFSPMSLEAGEFMYLTSKNVKNGYLDFSNIQYITKESHNIIYKSCDVKFGDVLLTKDGTIGQVCVNDLEFEFSLLSSVAFIRPKFTFDSYFLYHLISSERGQAEINKAIAGQALKRITLTKINDFKYSYPSLPEQQKIASFLTAVDDKIQQLSKKKELLEQYKKGVMQQLFSQKLRFKDDQGNEYPVWETRKLGDVCDCLDNQRRPLNESEREKIKGDIPYWGANAIMGFVNDYTFDETIVLLAEDGGNFNEYSTRPIANISYGKAWVNNHTHVIRGKSILCNEFLYYSVVHKNITAFVSGGTRSKLTKGEMLKIPLLIPILAEQQKIAKFLKAMDDKINSVNQQIEHNRQFKKGLLQQMFV